MPREHIPLKIAGQTVVMQRLEPNVWRGSCFHDQLPVYVSIRSGEIVESDEDVFYWICSAFDLPSWDSEGHATLEDAFDAGPGNCLVEATADALVFALGVNLRDAEEIADRICSDIVEPDDRPLVERLDCLFRLMAMRPVMAALVQAVWHDPDNLGGGGFCRPYVSAHERLEIERDVVALGLRPGIVDLSVSGR